MPGAEQSPAGDLLHRLATVHRISTRWEDVFGREHVVPEASLRALLASMGVPAGTEAELRAGLKEAHRAVWARVLPPVAVARAAALPASCALRVPAALAEDGLELVIEREGGGRETATVVPAQLERLEIASVEGTPYTAYRLPLPEAPLGYHRILLLRGGETFARSTFIVVPDRCYEPEAVRGSGRVWGLAVQLYALRSARNWGIGDFTDLHAALEQAAQAGADVVTLNPLHALFLRDPERASPYSPSSRLFLNALYLDPERIADFGECEAARATVGSPEFQARLRELRAAPLVDYRGVAECKLGVLEQLYASFRERHLEAHTPRAYAFRAFQERGGRALFLHAAFEALQEHFHGTDARTWGWPVWPSEYRDPESPAVARFCGEHAARLEFYQYLQWQADLQLGAVGARALALGFGVGLCGDLALSADPTGAESWANQRALAASTSIGAPPDAFNAVGQHWGLPPLLPRQLAEAAYAPFVDVLRTAMRHTGALRIDHAMGLERLYCIPEGASPAEGAYVSYPLEDLLGIIALESERNACLVIGEDLGTVSSTVRAALEHAGVLSYRLLLFERDAEGTFAAPADYPVQALAAISTHDLPTLAGFWEGRDLAVQNELGLFPSEEARERRIVERAQTRAQLLLALAREQLLPDGITGDPLSVPQMTAELARALHTYVARSPAKLFTVQMEDLLEAREQVNLPGTTEERHPNWRRKLGVELASMSADERVVRLAADLRRERPSARRALPAQRRAVIPRATYRVQLNAGFTFRDAAALVPYLADLGVSHVYCSPYFRARAGSTHGYDVVDHNAFNPEIGSREDFEHFVDALRAHGLAHILDIVPNHVGIMGADNAWWMDVLENGQASMYAQFFDIDWQPADPTLAGKILVPVLGEQYGVVLERGELRLRFEPEQGAFAICYHEHRFPIDPRDYPQILDRVPQLIARDGLGAEQQLELESLGAAFRHLPGRDELAAEAINERDRDKELLKRRLAALCAAHPALAQALEAAATEYAGTAGDPASFDRLHALLEGQAYRLADWRVASDEINYRRFFDVNDLAALRMENEAVFDAAHRLAFELIADGKLDGLRVDHPDGLYDPAQYFRRVQQRAGALPAAPEGGRIPPQELPLYLVAEKITAGFEHLPTAWPVHGTTGYRFANVVNGLFVDAGARRRLDRAYRGFVGEPLDWASTAYEAKHLIVRTSLAAELNVLTNQLVHIARATRSTRDFTANTLRQALAEVIACFPVYRTYVAESVSAEDRRYIEWALASARRRAAGTDAAVFDFVRAVLLREGVAAAEAVREWARAFAMKFQQVTAPVTAKGVEDTALYRFTRLASLNEVGGEPDVFGLSVRAFHADAQHRARHWPHELLATSTHDTKRSEDVRARLDVLSELPPGAWRRTVARWNRMNRSRKREVHAHPAPARDDEYLLYQTLLGSLPLEELDDAALRAYTERIDAYMAKAAREAKRHTSWANVDAAYEEALHQFVHGILERREGNLFLADLIATARRLSWFGLLNSLSQTLCKLTAPGVPDIYQGSELWDFSLVDPDNRRPVDYALRRTLLDDISSWMDSGAGGLAARARQLTQELGDGRAKLYLICQTLRFRRAQPALFAEGRYVPLVSSGERASHLCAFARVRDGGCIVVVAPRLYARLLGQRPEPPLGEAVWGDTVIELPRIDRAGRARATAQAMAPAGFTGLLDGTSLEAREREGRWVLSAAEVLANFPVGVVTNMGAAAVEP
ncbi:MAG: malto-oligosyltrehalose synthase [Candidatus Binatia bacterium]